MRSLTLPAPTARRLASALLLTLAAAPLAAKDEAATPPPLDACLAAWRPAALAAGVRGDTFDSALADVQGDPSVLAALDHQPEFRTPIWDYLAALVDEERVRDGEARLAEHANTLAAVSQRYGVDPATVVAVWGAESDYGRVLGGKPLLGSLATLSCHGRRQGFFRGELLATLRLLQSGDLEAEGLVGSWAGAFGQTQFMPSTYARLAVDFDGDGRRDLVGSTADALASTANYLAKAGWRPGEPWGEEVRLPAGFDANLAGRTARRPLSQWQALGLRRLDGSALPGGDTRAALLLPAGKDGPAFLVRRNFDAIYSYNAAESYALAIAHLADRLRGGGPFATPWPTDDPGLSRAQRRELQALLLARGHDIGEVDGVIGARTREAIQAEQRAAGLPEDGRAGLALLQRLAAVTQLPAPE